MKFAIERQSTIYHCPSKWQLYAVDEETRCADRRGHVGESSKAVDTKGRPMDDWTVVHNPSSRTPMTLELQHTLDHDSVVCCVRFRSDTQMGPALCRMLAFFCRVGCSVHLNALSRTIYSPASLWPLSLLTLPPPRQQRGRTVPRHRLQQECGAVRG